MEIRESGEMYLETIFLMKKRGEKVRSVDLCSELNYAKSSVSLAVNKLKHNGYIFINNNGEIDLTEKGLEVVNDIFDKHVTLKKFLMSFDIDENIAEQDACKIEHIISKESFVKIKEYLNSKNK